MSGLGQSSKENEPSRIRVLEFRFKPGTLPEEYKPIVHRLFGYMYDGETWDIEDGYGEGSVLAWTTSDKKEITQVPEDKLTDDDRETRQLIQEHFVGELKIGEPLLPGSTAELKVNPAPYYRNIPKRKIK